MDFRVAKMWGLLNNGEALSLYRESLLLELVGRMDSQSFSQSVRQPVGRSVSRSVGKSVG
jgi:hypothetical protein